MDSLKQKYGCFSDNVWSFTEYVSSSRKILVIRILLNYWVFDKEKILSSCLLKTSFVFEQYHRKLFYDEWGSRGNLIKNVG